MLLNEDGLNELYEEWMASEEENWEIYVAKAQLRKVIEWIETQHSHSAGWDSPSGANIWFGLKYDEWEKLKREIE